jgi:hypothetical protein
LFSASSLSRPHRSPASPPPTCFASVVPPPAPDGHCFLMSCPVYLAPALPCPSGESSELWLRTHLPGSLHTQILNSSLPPSLLWKALPIPQPPGSPANLPAPRGQAVRSPPPGGLPDLPEKSTSPSSWLANPVCPLAFAWITVAWGYVSTSVCDLFNNRNKSTLVLNRWENQG